MGQKSNKILQLKQSVKVLFWQCLRGFYIVWWPGEGETNKYDLQCFLKLYNLPYNPLVYGVCLTISLCNLL